MQMHTTRNQKSSISNTVIEQTYWNIRQNIITGVHVPGTKLPIGELARRYNVSSGTIRESLSRLVTESLVDAFEQRGFSVSSMSLQELKEITEVRLLLEKEALRQSIQYGDENWEADLVSAFHLLNRIEGTSDSWLPKDIEEWEERNWVFHISLIAACPSTWLKKMVGVLYRQWARYCYCAITSSKTPSQLNNEHRAICDAALARDAVTAEHLLSAHIHDTAQRLLSSGLTFGEKAGEKPSQNESKGDVPPSKRSSGKQQSILKTAS